MGFSVAPLADVPADLVREFFHRVGVSREIAEWRYLDSEFNRGSNRGFAWLPRGRIEGMIGLIPFRLSVNGSTRTANWSSDWMLADPAANPGMGIVLLRQAIESSQQLFALGGNENTRQLLPRIAALTVPDAGLALHLPLRSGALLRRMERRAALRRLTVPDPLYRIPLRWVQRGGQQPEVRTAQGLAQGIAGLLDGDGGEGAYPAYDLAYVDWQIARSPLLNCWTTYSPSAEEPRAAALYWAPRSSPDFWRVAVWSHRQYPEHLIAVLREAVSQMYQRDAMAISTIVSHLDVEAAAALHSVGFMQAGQRRALYVCTARDSPYPVPELRGLSYLASDLGYRF